MHTGRWVGLFTALGLSFSLIAILLVMTGGGTTAAGPDPTPTPVLHTGPGAQPAGRAPAAPAVALTKTVGTDSSLCPTLQSIDLPAGGGQVTYCYSMRNTGTVPFSRLTLVDDQLGTIISNFVFTLNPGASVFITRAAAITVTTVNSATFTAFNPGPTDIASSSDKATVKVALSVPAVVLTKTVCTDPNLCAADQSLDLPAGGGQVFYCYMMRNTGTVSFSRLTLIDDRLGTILNNFPFTLSPGSSAFITQTTTITVTTVNSATFTAFNPGPTDIASSSDQATVNVTPALASVVLTKTVGLDPAICATTSQVQLPLGGGPVTYCYQMTNTGNIDLNRLTLDDNRLGSILASFPFNLTPGASAFITVGAAITRTTDNLATFTAVQKGTPYGAEHSDRAQVLVPGQVFLPFIRRSG